MSERIRVAVTGLGVKAPVGTDLGAFWRGLCAGTSAGARITSFDASIIPVDFACEIHDFDPLDYLDLKGARKLDRTAQLGLAAATDALADAGDVGVPAGRRAVIVGTGHGGTRTHESEFAHAHQRGFDRANPQYVPMSMANATTGAISIRHDLRGPSLCIATACASGSNAIGEGARLIREGSADVVVAGGAESPIAPLTISAFARMGALSKRTDDPAHASRPFDGDRDGFVIGEGAGFLVLESWDLAVRRGARIYAELSGYGRCSDAHHITAPSPGGEGAATCMQLALADGRTRPDEIVHINAHGTSTPLNDLTESRAIGTVFGGSPPPVTSNKGAIGHLVGAAGAVEAVATVLSMTEGQIPPTANHEKLDPDCDLDVVTGVPRKLADGPVISNSFGFGGHNVTLLFAPSER